MRPDGNLLVRLVLISILIVPTWLVVSVAGNRQIIMRKMVVRILIAMMIGFLLAGESTHIIYSPCLASDTPGVPYNAPPNEESLTRCAEIAKAIDKPYDLIHNKQDSLVGFSETFVITALISFAILELVARNKKRRSKKEK
jgi:hypothetical protein